jgi:exodeoxyribonuclease VII large subunit
LNAPARPVLTVSELAAAIKNRLETGFADVLVRGEVSALATPASGHIYFTLKDNQAAIRCVLYRHMRRWSRVTPQENREYLVRGKVSAYAPRSEYQIVVDYLEPLGLGALYAAYLELQQRLAARGWFAPERKRPLPLFPATIGIVTSLAGAALHDMLRIIRARRPGQRVAISPTLVQGEGAASAIAGAIRRLAEFVRPDVIIVGRGGGSPEDLWCWNEEEVVRAVVECPVPVVSGVGHEVDVSLCDLAADLRAATPTHAAELVTPDAAELAHKIHLLNNRARRAVEGQRLLLRRRLEHADHRLRREAAPTALLGRRLDELSEKLRDRCRRLLDSHRHRLALLGRFLEAASPRKRLAQRGQNLTELTMRLRQAAMVQHEKRQHRLTVAVARLQAVSPYAVLERGYAIVTNEQGRILREATDARVGERPGRADLAYNPQPCAKVR